MSAVLKNPDMAIPKCAGTVPLPQVNGKRPQQGAHDDQTDESAGHDGVELGGSLGHVQDPISSEKVQADSGGCFVDLRGGVMIDGNEVSCLKL